MNHILMLVLTFGSFSLYSSETIDLLVGQTASINGDTVTCSASSNTAIINSYQQIPYAHKFNMLKFGGIGTCYIDTIQNINFLHTDQFPSGLRISIKSGYMINEALQNGDCSL